LRVCSRLLPGTGRAGMGDSRGEKVPGGDDTLEPAHPLSAIMRALVNLSAPAAIVGPDHTIACRNRAFEAEFGTPGDNRCYECLHGTDGPCAGCPIDSMAKGGSTRTEWTSKKTGKTYSLSTTRLPTECGIYALHICYPIVGSGAVNRLRVALESERQKLRQYFEALPVLAYNVTPDGKIADCNTRAVEVLEYETKNDLVGRPLIDTIYAPSSREKARQVLRRWRLEGRIESEELEIITRTGKTISVLLNVDTILDENSRPLHSLSTQIDISELKQASRAVADERDNLISVLQALEDGLLITDEDYDVIYVNSLIEGLYGPWRGKKCYQYFEVGEAVCEHCPGETVYSGRNTRREWLCPKNQRVYEIVDTLVRNPDGTRSRVEIFRDITDRKQAEDQLGLQLELLRTLMDTLPTPIFYKDIDGRYMGCNRAFEECLGLAQQEIIGKTAYDIVPWVDADEHCRHDKELFANPGRQTYQWRVRNGEGEMRDVVFHKATLRGPGGLIAGLVGNIVDISDLKSTESALRESESALLMAKSQLEKYSEELEQLVESRTERIMELERQRAAGERLAATGRMAARLAHEINNPLAGIKNSFLLIRKAVPEDHPRRGYVDLIETEIDRIAMIIRKMFELYRDEEQIRRPVSLVGSIKEVFTLLESSVRAREISLVLDPPEGPVLARLQAGYLTQVMFNLLRNAIEASPTAATITVSLRTEGSEAVIEVRDRGSGIAPEHRDLIFEPFFTTKPEEDHEGVGLGLSVSRSMVEAMGGSITFETTLGKGTTFIVRLPCEMEEEDE
jgi:PAS domain S-box-containing protein